ncbi:histidinol dehydrogenase [bacterium]|nr:histidinol dehydrogenase [bacterium]
MALMKTLDARSRDLSALEALRHRTFEEVPTEVEDSVRQIMEDVRDRGDVAVVEHTRKLDCPTFTAEHLPITEEEIQAAYAEVDAAWIGAFRRARENVQRFQERAKHHSWLETFDGLVMGHQVTPVRSAGIYTPAKHAPLPSSLLMSAIPARVAGVERIVLATPPRTDGSVDPTMLVAAAECGVDEAYRIGGAQAIAALAYGTETIEAVVKIVGPGSPWVAVAKKHVFGVVGIESLAGPSESLIIADRHAQPDLVAADLLTQAEHTGDNTVILLTDSPDLAAAVQTEVEAQLSELGRSELTRRSLEECSLVVVTETLRQAVAIANDIAPEHLQILVQDPFDLLEGIENAGCIFLGEKAPVPLGDYAAGPSHVLPTYGTARFSSPLSVNDFLVTSSVIYANSDGLDRLAGDVIELAEGEGLTAHAEAVRRRQR